MPELLGENESPCAHVSESRFVVRFASQLHKGGESSIRQSVSGGCEVDEMEPNTLTVSSCCR